MKLKNILLSGMMAAILAVGSVGMTVNAANVVEIPSTEVDSVYNLEVDSNTLEGWATGPQIYSESGIVMDIDSGAILYAKNIDDQHYPASITKVATALIALQNYELDETVTFTWDDIGFLEYGDAHIGIKDGEELVMEDALYGMLLASANEVSHAIGAHMEGGYDKFLEVMNATVQELGCKNTHFMNTHGLHDPEHYTSVRDMALIGSAVFQYDKFREITNTQQYTIPATNITAETRTFQQNHKMIWKANANYYEYCVGGKTGYTDQALTTLVTFATKDDTNLVAVVMRTHGGGTNAYIDTRAMLDYAFDNFTKVPITKKMVGNENVSKVADDSYVVLPSGVTVEQLESSFEAPTELKDKTGKVTYTYEGQEVGVVEVTITDEYYNEIHGIKEEVKEENQEKKTGLPFIVKLILGILAVIVIGFVALVGFVYYKRKQLEKKRRLRRMQYRKQREEQMRDL
ncbi:MAG: D-alanyl-D-alanine carboxypeptidase [Tyzzerella sp.]|nr:D-alanyl-D-alanine carboxypeptidase [Tyzzerella sp.]